MDDEPEVRITRYSLLDPPGTAGPPPDRSWVDRVPSSWPATGTDGRGGVADAAFAAARESFLAAPPAPEFLRPVRVDRDGDVAVLVFAWRSDPRRFAIRVDLPTVLEQIDDGWGEGAVWGIPEPQTGFVTSGPVDWADGLDGWLEEELLTGAIRSRNHRDGDLVVVDLADRGVGEEDREYHLSGGTWGRTVDRALGIDQESVPPAKLVSAAGFPTAALVALDVAPAHAGRGLEERLLAHALGDAADAGTTTIDGLGAAPPPRWGWSTDPAHPGRVRLDV